MQSDTIFVKLKNHTMCCLEIHASAIKLYLESKAMTTLRSPGEARLWAAEMKRAGHRGGCWLLVVSWPALRSPWAPGVHFILTLSCLHISYLFFCT